MKCVEEGGLKLYGGVNDLISHLPYQDFTTGTKVTSIITL